MGTLLRSRLLNLINATLKNSSSNLCFQSAHRAVHVLSTQQIATINNQKNIKLENIRPISFSSRVCSEEEDGHAEEQQKTDPNQVKEEIYEEAMKFVNEHGWTRKTLSLGAEAAGYAGVAEGLFSGGEELAIHFIKSCNKELVVYLQEMAAVQENPETKVPVPDFIRNAIEFRLRMLIPYIEVWPRALALLHSPLVLKQTVTISGQMVDDIWYYAGDRSTDINWYTKRAMLAKLYASTQLAMLNDNSPDFQETWNFLDRRMDDIKTMGSIARSLSTVPKTLCDAGMTGVSTVLNMAGISKEKRS